MNTHCHYCESLQSRLLKVFRVSSSGTDFISAFAALGWVVGLVIVTPFDSTKTYAEMTYVFPLEVWSGIFIALFVAQNISLFQPPTIYRSTVSFIAAGIWGLIAGLTFMATPWMPGPWVFGVIAIANAWAFGQHEVTRWIWDR